MSLEDNKGRIEVGMGERTWRLAKRLCKELTRITNCKFIAEEEDHDFLVCTNVCEDFRDNYGRYFHKYPVKTPDGRELGLMYTHKNLSIVYFDEKRRIKWPDDWIDPYPASIEKVSIFNDRIEIWKGHEVELGFMCHAYYNTHISAGYFLNREYRMKLARFVPAVIKDFNIFLKLSDEICNKYKLDKFITDTPEVLISSKLGSEKFVIDMPDILACAVWFNIESLNDEEVIDKVIRGVEALTELRRNFREWLPSDKRREYYQSTMLYPEDPFRERMPVNYIIKWPYKSCDLKKDAEEERSIKVSLWYDGRIKPPRKYYNFDGYGLRLARKTGENLEFLGKIIERGVITYDDIGGEDLNREDIVIAVDERLEKLQKFPLEKIEFLREDFPEMFKE